MRAVGNALELKLYKIPMIREQEPNSPPTSGSPIAKAIGCFTGVSVIKLMPLSVFIIKIKEPAHQQAFS
ncbi:hypothetical protein HMPREF0462_0185 [Helicobacter pylori 83]|uniref:Uncharacterized protein n=1 Tax=Helicobacter pylori 83 TaxID=585538 RepID=F4D3J5_HELPX|nr:hypothetical protein HMPREF0462_0185 [Helicobacter pylori 83]